MSDNKTILIEGTDLCIASDQDSTNTQNAGPKGYVEIYEVDEETGEKILVHESSNLVVYLGREWLISRAIRVASPDSSCGTFDEFICWVGFGYGGVDPMNPLVPIPPLTTDTNLYCPRMINVDSKGLYADWGNYGDSTGYYKVNIDQTRFEADSLNDNAYLKVVLSAYLDPDDAADKDISEVGLFTADSNEEEIPGPFHLYARLTFPTIIKQNNRRLLINWRLYF